MTTKSETNKSEMIETSSMKAGDIFLSVPLITYVTTFRWRFSDLCNIVSGFKICVDQINDSPKMKNSQLNLEHLRTLTVSEVGKEFVSLLESMDVVRDSVVVSTIRWFQQNIDRNLNHMRIKDAEDLSCVLREIYDECDRKVEQAHREGETPASDLICFEVSDENLSLIKDFFNINYNLFLRQEMGSEDEVKTCFLNLDTRTECISPHLFQTNKLMFVQFSYYVCVRVKTC